MQILTLTAELLAMDLRKGNRTMEQVETRSLALTEAIDRVTRAARNLPAPDASVRDGDGGSFADAEPLRTIRAFVGFITDHARRPDVDRDVLAEYVDGLHDRARALIADIDRPRDR